MSEGLDQSLHGDSLFCQPSKGTELEEVLYEQLSEEATLRKNRRVQTEKNKPPKSEGEDA